MKQLRCAKEKHSAKKTKVTKHHIFGDFWQPCEKNSSQSKSVANKLTLCGLSLLLRKTKVEPSKSLTK